MGRYGYHLLPPILVPAGDRRVVFRTLYSPVPPQSHLLSQPEPQGLPTTAARQGGLN